MTSDVLWKDILEIHPILSHYQELACQTEQGAPLLGAKLFYRTQRSTWDGRILHTLTLVVPFLGCLHGLMFANDFAAQHSSIDLFSNSTKYRASVQVVKMGPPSLKENSNWDGPVLRNVEWLGGLDDKFSICSTMG